MRDWVRSEVGQGLFDVFAVIFRRACCSCGLSFADRLLPFLAVHLGQVRPVRTELVERQSMIRRNRLKPAVEPWMAFASPPCRMLSTRPGNSAPEYLRRQRRETLRGQPPHWTRRPVLRRSSSPGRLRWLFSTSLQTHSGSPGWQNPLSPLGRLMSQMPQLAGESYQDQARQIRPRRRSS